MKKLHRSKAITAVSRMQIASIKRDLFKLTKKDIEAEINAVRKKRK